MSSTTKTAHTPGPWELDSAKDGGCRYFQIDAPTPKELAQKPAFGYTVADTMNRHYCITPEEDEANARLIAAAPEMLEALEAAYKLFAKNHALSRFDWGSSALRAEDIRELNELPLQLRAAIAKGGQ